MIFDLILVYGFEAFEIDHAIAERVQGAKSFVEKTADEGGEEDEESISDILKENGEEKSQTSIMQLNFGADSTTSASSIILNSLVMLLDGEVCYYVSFHEFSYFGTKVWNVTLNDIGNLESTHLFKQKMKTYLLDH